MCVTVFFFKQKTAYDMRISDWSSDVCSSYLLVRNAEHPSCHGQRLSRPATQPRHRSRARLVPLGRSPGERRRRKLARRTCDLPDFAGVMPPPRPFGKNSGASKSPPHVPYRPSRPLLTSSTRQRAVCGKRVSVIIALGGRLLLKKKTQ